MLVWTAEARRQLLPRRDLVEELRAPRKRPAVGAAWGSLRRVLNRDGIIGQTFIEGRESAKPPYDEWMAKCAAIARNKTMATFDEANVAAVFALLMRLHVEHALVHSIYPKRGMVFAFDVALRMLAMEAHTRPFWYVKDRVTQADPDLAWRDALLAHSERAACKDLAAQLWPSASLAQKTTIAYAFFDDAAWANEVCKEWLVAGNWPAAVLYPIVADKDLAFELVRRRTQSRCLLELIETFGDDILPVLVEVAEAPKDGDARHAAQALAQFEDERAAKGLASLVKFAVARPSVQAYFVRYPQFADALAPHAANKNRAAAVASDLLEGAKRIQQEGTEATLEELPAIFTHPPWLTKRKAREPASVTPVERSMMIAWKPGERERALAHRHMSKPPASPETIDAHSRALERRYNVGFFTHNGELLPDASTVAVWNAGVSTYDATPTERMRYALAKLGEDATDGLERFVDGLERDGGDPSLLLRVASPRIALGMAHLRKSAKCGRLAWQWLRTHGDLAVLGLVPYAMAGDEDAKHALVRLASVGIDVGDLGDLGDVLDDVPKKLPKLSWKPETLTRPVTLGGKRLPLLAVHAIGTMLAFSPLDPPYAGIALVKSICTPRSLAELAWDAARSWEYAGHKARDKWMLMSLVHFADAEVIRRMTPAMRDDLTIDVLQHIDSDIALMELLTIIGRTSDAKVVQRIEAILERAAALRGIEQDELEEDLAPVKPVEDDGTVSLDFGPRKLRVGFDEHLVPYVITEDGGRSRALAPARNTDDPERAEQAKALWRDLKEDVAVLAARRVASLKRAMSSGRTWSVQRFHRIYIENGLMKHIARGVVWTDGSTAFRVAEDGSFTTSNDVSFKLVAQATVMVLHPLRAASDEIDRWRSLFADYCILQPFPQLERSPLDAPRNARLAWPFATSGTVADFTASILQHGFTSRYNQNAWRYRRDLSRGALDIDIKGAPIDRPIVELFFEGDPDMIEVADILDDLQSSIPSTRR